MPRARVTEQTAPVPPHQRAGSGWCRARDGLAKPWPHHPQLHGLAEQPLTAQTIFSHSHNLHSGTFCQQQGLAAPAAHPPSPRALQQHHPQRDRGLTEVTLR